MKRSNKFLLGGVFVLLIGWAAYINYQRALPKEQLSDLTLANLEAMALPPDFIDIDGDIYTGDMTGRNDCQVQKNSSCGMTISTPSGGYVEYVQGATHRPGWAN